MVNVRFIAFAVFFHAVVASPLYFPKNRPTLHGRQDAAVTSSFEPAATAATLIGLPDSARLGSPVLECQDAVAGFCESTASRAF